MTQEVGEAVRFYKMILADCRRARVRLSIKDVDPNQLDPTAEGGELLWHNDDTYPNDVESESDDEIQADDDKAKSKPDIFLRRLSGALYRYCPTEIGCNNVVRMAPLSLFPRTDATDARGHSFARIIHGYRTDTVLPHGIRLMLLQMNSSKGSSYP